MPNIRKIHHVAYRCKDAKTTVEWYQKHLGMNFVLAIAEDQVPSTHAPDPYMHLFMDAGGGNILAFFELPNSPEMGRDPNTPDWVQHIALEVDTVAELERQGWAVTRLAADADGLIQPASVQAALRADTRLVSLMAVNSTNGAVVSTLPRSS